LQLDRQQLAIPSGFLGQPVVCDDIGPLVGGGEVRKPQRGEMTKESFTEFLTDVFGCLANNTTAGSIHYTFMDWRHVDEMNGSRQECLHRAQKSTSLMVILRPFVS